ncbi:mevalonate kinase [Candidatus Bathyarchaeota archaeon]|nr:mevalonate kinase [Candidatus Bathyarchaeota archaeon]
MKACGSAPGKIILTGEHFVVYDEPALVVAIDRRVTVKVAERKDKALRIVSDLGIAGVFEDDLYRVEKGGTDSRSFLEPVKIAAETVMDKVQVKQGLDIFIQSSIPAAAGLGSSSATAVATVASVGKILEANLSQKDISDLSLAAERFVHITPSGVDTAIATYGGVILYERGEGITRFQDTPDLALVIGNTGLTRNTGNLIKHVRERRNRLYKVIDPLIELAGNLTRNAIETLRNGDLVKFGELMDVNHGLLVAIGVSNEVLDRLVYAARIAGALGAKLTGAGGGGCMVALCRREMLEKVAEAIHSVGGIPIIAEKVETGVQVWTES